jgi:transcriptional regulator with XRE-family HTH domain
VPQPTLAQLGAAIRELRTQRSLTLETLAHEAHLHPVSISRIEAGDQNLTWLALSGIAAALDVEILELVRLALAKAPTPGE